MLARNYHSGSRGLTALGGSTDGSREKMSEPHVRRGKTMSLFTASQLHRDREPPLFRGGPGHVL
ncbi:hypothetical protein JZ751_006144 [Albula glossodonta]|uniref:Uncharacterized protein n=1 Tax=Albula glossodonta TaxID=121402 RepID=A0A8T2N4Q8_9TELE|nr:hypothetical protein JZ751_006144 [Albula glossodonta]